MGKCQCLSQCVPPKALSPVHLPYRYQEAPADTKRLLARFFNDSCFSNLEYCSFLLADTGSQRYPRECTKLPLVLGETGLMDGT